VQNVCFWLYGCVRIALEIPTQNDEELTIRQTFNIHGDNIVECVRAFDYVLSGLSTLVLDVAGPILSVTCPVYIVTLPDSELQFQFLPGYGERRWNQDVLGFVKRAGGRLREAADAIITRIKDGSESAVAAIEFCGALPAGNQAWQRQGRAFSFAHAGIPYFYVAELGGFELGADRARKAERMPNPAIPFSFYAITHYQRSVCLPVYEANPGARVETVELYNPIYGKAEFLDFLKLAVLGNAPEHAAEALGDKCFALVDLLATSKKRQDGLSSAQWREAKTALEGGETLPDYLSREARLAWSKTAYIASLTDTARSFMTLGSRDSFGLTSSKLPLSFVPKDRRAAFASSAKVIYGDMADDFAAWLAQDDAHLAIAWVMGFKPGGDDARPDRGLAPLARMLVGDDTELLTFVYGPATVSHWQQLAANPVALAASNGLWESVMAVSDGLLVDSASKPADTPRGYRKDAWAAVLINDDTPLMVTPRVLLLGEQDVDTALHVAFESLGDDVVFEGMCNPPGGDWSGISFRWAKDAPEYRWLTLPRVSAEGAKRPDHVFAIFGHEGGTVCLCVESKERARSLELRIGPRLIRYAEALFESVPSIQRGKKLDPWAIYGDSWATQSVSFVSAGAYLSDADDPFLGLPGGTDLDLQIGVSFSVNADRCELHLRGDTAKGKALVGYLASLSSWGQFVTVKVNN